jgi:hypothetical protein
MLQVILAYEWLEVYFTGMSVSGTIRAMKAAKKTR